jgi:hypothetical protein
MTSINWTHVGLARDFLSIRLNSTKPPNCHRSPILEHTTNSQDEKYFLFNDLDLFMYLTESGDSSVGIAAGYGLDGRSSIPGRGYSIVSRPALQPTQPPIQWVSGTLSPMVKQPGREADHSPTSRSRMVELYLHSPIRIHGVVLN